MPWSSTWTTSADDDIVGLNIPNGIPLVYELDADLKPIQPLLPGRRRSRCQGRRGRGHARQGLIGQSGQPQSADQIKGQWSESCRPRSCGSYDRRVIRKVARLLSYRAFRLSLSRMSSM